MNNLFHINTGILDVLDDVEELGLTYMQVTFDL